MRSSDDTSNIVRTYLALHIFNENERIEDEKKYDCVDWRENECTRYNNNISDILDELYGEQESGQSHDEYINHFRLKKCIEHDRENDRLKLKKIEHEKYVYLLTKEHYNKNKELYAEKQRINKEMTHIIKSATPGNNIPSRKEIADMYFNDEKIKYLP